MARKDPQINIRLPLHLKEALENAAYADARSLTAEIVLRLEQSFLAYAESDMLERRAKDATVLRTQLARTISEIEGYEARLASGAFGPLGPEWLSETIAKKTERVEMLRAYLEKAESDVASLLDLTKASTP